MDTIFNNGDTVTFDNTGSTTVPVYVAGTPQPALVTFNSVCLPKNAISSAGWALIMPHEPIKLIKTRQQDADDHQHQPLFRRHDHQQ